MNRKKDMEKPVDKSFEEQKLELIRLRIKNAFYNNNYVLEDVVNQIIRNEIKKDGSDK